MDLMETVKIIKEFFPEKAVELSETLGLLRDTMEGHQAGNQETNGVAL